MAKARREEGHKFLAEYFEKNPCVDCGNDDILTLEFDHRDGRGSSERSVVDLALAGGSRKRLMEEIDKCDVRCANCHKIVTYKRSGSWRLNFRKDYQHS